MLKIAGASCMQIKISLFLLKAMVLLGALIIYCSHKSRNEDDGKYAATVFWHAETKRYDIQFWGQSNDPAAIKCGAAKAYYQPDISKTGWATLEIETNEKYPDYVQAFSAGMLEGSLSWLSIYWHWKNTVEKACISRQWFCEYVREFLENNRNVIRSKAIMYDMVDPFWHQINLFYIQLDGLEYGWNFEVARNRKAYEISSLDFLWMNIMSDVKDFERKLNASRSPNPNSASSSMILLKLIREVKRDHFLLAHASSGLYSSMLRIRKKYKFGYHETGSGRSPLVAGQNIRFTSYPASIHSQDDFYQIKLSNGENVTIAGSAIYNYNHKSWNLIDSQRQILIGLRVMASNRLSANGKTWSFWVTKFNSGTGNKQWLHVHKKKETKSITLWVTEQMPGKILSSDESRTLYQQGHWISCGIPHFQEIQLMSNNEELSRRKYSITVSYLQIFEVLKSGQENVTDVDSLLHLMRGPDLTMAGRTDLYEDRGYPATSHRDLPYRHRGVLKKKNFQPPSAATKTSSDIKRETYAMRKMAPNNATCHSCTKAGQSDTGSKNVSSPGDVDFKYVDVQYAELSTFSLKYNTTIKNLFTVRNVIYLCDPFTLLNLTRNFRNVESPPPLSDNYSDGSGSVGKSNDVDQIKYFDLDGVIDLKIADDNAEFTAAAGPPFTVKNNLRPSIDPFQWSKSRIKYLPHNGHADVWNYMPVTTAWQWN